jgi:hypothetical protein
MAQPFEPETPNAIAVDSRRERLEAVAELADKGTRQQRAGLLELGNLGIDCGERISIRFIAIGVIQSHATMDSQRCQWRAQQSFHLNIAFVARVVTMQECGFQVWAFPTGGRLFDPVLARYFAAS